QNIDTKKFIPIVRNNPSPTKIPRFLGLRFYIDFSNDGDYAAKLDELLREIHGVGRGKPPLGPNPFTGTVPQQPTISRTAGPSGLAASGALVLEDAWFEDHVAAAQR